MVDEFNNNNLNNTNKFRLSAVRSSELKPIEHEDSIDKERGSNTLKNEPIKENSDKLYSLINQ